VAHRVAHRGDGTGAVGEDGGRSRAQFGQQGAEVVGVLVEDPVRPGRVTVHSA
jgi:hypothetical protein